MTSIEFRLLGPLDVKVDGEVVPVRGARQQVVLAVLLLEANRVVPVERLIEAVWADAPPATARSQIQMAVSDLRRRFSGYVDTPFIASHPAGYSAAVAAEALDVHRFDQHVAAGRDAVRRGDVAAGAEHLRHALGVWRGEAVAGLYSRVVESAALRLNEQRLSVLEECIGLELRLGQHHEVIGELRELVGVHPLREGLHAHLMLALYRAGRQAEALEAFRVAHRVLADEHGLDPGEQLTSLERAILTNDPALSRPDAADGVTLSTNHPVPRQLPAAVPDFAGREQVIADLIGRLSRAAEPEPRGLEVAVISGAGGVGKSALAVHVAHLVRDLFPDGQLYARLRGVDAQPVRAKQVLQDFLRSLGVLPTAMPDSLEEMSKEFRSRLAGARVLIVLDDASLVDQVVPLLPGDAGCAVMVTSRRSLSGLTAAYHVDLDVLDEVSSVRLLAYIIGSERVDAEPAAAAALAEACGRLPLALRIAAAKLAARRHWSVGRMLDRLSDERRRLDELALEGVGVRASIAFSYHALSEDARRLLLLLSLLGTADFADWVPMPLLDADEDRAGDTLQELIEASLVIIEAAPRRDPRYRLHDLVRIFAQESLANEVNRHERLDAQLRLIRTWVYLCRNAHIVANGGDFTVLHSDAVPWPLPDRVVDRMMSEPTDWLAMEHANIATAIDLAAQLGNAAEAWDLVMTAVTLFESRSYTDSWRAALTVASDACQLEGDERGVAAMMYSSGELALLEDRFDEARIAFDECLRYFERAGDEYGQGLTLRNLAYIARTFGELDESLELSMASLPPLRAAGDHSATSFVLSGMAQVYLDRGDVATAEEYLREAVSLSSSVLTRTEAQVRNRLGNLYLVQGRLNEAESEFAGVLKVVHRIGDLVGMVYGQLGVGLVSLARGDVGRAQQVLADARHAAEDTGDRMGLGRVLLAQAEASMAAGDSHSARAHLAEARSVLVTVGAGKWLERTSDLEERLTK